MDKLYISVKLLKEIAKENGIDPERRGDYPPRIPSDLLDEPVELSLLGYDKEKIEKIEELGALVGILCSQVGDILMQGKNEKMISILGLTNKSLDILFEPVHKTLEYGMFYRGVLYKHRPSNQKEAKK